MSRPIVQKWKKKKKNEYGTMSRPIVQKWKKRKKNMNTVPCLGLSFKNGKKKKINTVPCLGLSFKNGKKKKKTGIWYHV